LILTLIFVPVVGLNTFKIIAPTHLVGIIYTWSIYLYSCGWLKIHLIGSPHSCGRHNIHLINIPLYSCGRLKIHLIGSPHSCARLINDYRCSNQFRLYTRYRHCSWLQLSIN
jgi:hypothetical protein